MTRPITEFLMPTLAERLARAQGDLRLGMPIVLAHGAARALVLAVEALDPGRLQGLCASFAAPELVLTAKRGQAVLPHRMAEMGAGPVRLQPPAFADSGWYRRLADPGLDRLGPVGPLHLIREGTTDLQRLALTLVKSAELLPAAVLFEVNAADLEGQAGSLVELSVDATLAHLDQAPTLAPVAASRLPIEAHDSGRLHVFRDPDGLSEHFAMEIGSPNRDVPVLCRVHSACFTGDVLGSLKCDCGPQLRTALARMGEEGAGVLLYLNQEGRGIGLANKMRVYDLQAHGFDTVEANHRLGFEDDERDFRVAADMLRKLGFGAIRLLTNNPAKVITLSAQGVTVVERVPLRVGETPFNRDYLAVKALKSGHAL